MHKGTLLCLLIVVVTTLACSLKCEHGGTPSSDCSKCEDCGGAWKGKLCDQWDSSVPYSKVLEELLALAGHKDHPDNSKLMVGEPNLPGDLGMGLDISTGTPKLPILQMNYTAGKIWKNSKGKAFAMAHESSVSGYTHQTVDSQVYEGMYDYIQFLFGFSNSHVVNASASLAETDDLVSFYTKYFSGGSFMTVAQKTIPIYNVKLDKGISGYPLDPRALRALQSLPPAYDTNTNKAVYRTFVQYWGTHVVTGSLNGGAVEQQTFFQKTLLDNYDGPYTRSGVAKQSKNEFEGEMGASTSVEKTWKDKRTLGTFGCRGGNAAELCDKKKISTWIASIESAPTQLSYEVADFTSVLGPFGKNVKKAIQDFLAEQHKKWSEDFPTCPTCMWGTCSQGDKKCTCYNPNIKGAACDSCEAGWHNDQCTVPICEKPCYKYGGTCTSPNKCTCNKHYYGPTCSPVCGDGIVQYPEQCDDHSQCCTGSCTFAPYGSFCGSAFGPCEDHPTCAGYSTECKKNYKSSSTVCKQAIYECDSPITCDGFSANCPPTSRSSKAGQTCYHARGQCEQNVQCSYSGGPCPSNHYAPSGTPCTDFMGKRGTCSFGNCRSY